MASAERVTGSAVPQRGGCGGHVTPGEESAEGSVGTHGLYGGGASLGERFPQWRSPPGVPRLYHLQRAGRERGAMWRSPWNGFIADPAAARSGDRRFLLRWKDEYKGLA